MPYTIVFSTNDVEDVSRADAKTALEALVEIAAIQSRGEEIFGTPAFVSISYSEENGPSLAELRGRFA